MPSSSLLFCFALFIFLCKSKSNLFLQGGNGPDKYSNKSSAAKDVTSDVVSLDMATGGQPLVVKNLSKPIKVKIKQPINPYPPTQHTSYTHLLKTVSLVNNPSDNLSSIFIDIRNTSEVCFLDFS